LIGTLGAGLAPNLLGGIDPLQSFGNVAYLQNDSFGLTDSRIWRQLKALLLATQQSTSSSLPFRFTNPIFEPTLSSSSVVVLNFKADDSLLLALSIFLSPETYE
jgi:hypothetical protein